MPLLIAARYSDLDMPELFDPGALEDLQPDEYVVVPRGDSEDVARVACREYRSSEHLALRRRGYPRILRRASPEEVEAWWERKLEERRAMVLAKEKAAELRLDIKVSRARVMMHERAVAFDFTSEQRIDFRALVKELSAALRMRIDLWQVGVRDEAKLLDGYGVCGLKTCCSTWLPDFRPINIRMAKDQDINLPPTKLSGQCGRLLCCLSYEVDQYREMNREALPKGSTVTLDGKQWTIIDRNLLAGTYQLMDEARTVRVAKLAELQAAEVRVPDQMKKMARTAIANNKAAAPRPGTPTADAEATPAATGDAPKPPRQKDRDRGERGERGGRQHGPAGDRPDTPREDRHAPEPQPAPAEPSAEAPDDNLAEPSLERKERRRRRDRNRGRGGDRPPRPDDAPPANPPGDAPAPDARPAADGDNAPERRGFRRRKNRKR